MWCPTAINTDRNKRLKPAYILFHSKWPQVFDTHYGVNNYFIFVSIESKQKFTPTYIKRLPLGQRKSDLLRQVTPLKRFNSYEIVCDKTGNMWLLNTGDCLIEVTAWTDLTVAKLFIYTCIFFQDNKCKFHYYKTYLFSILFSQV
jgi:hypothetical protein